MKNIKKSDLRNEFVANVRSIIAGARSTAVRSKNGMEWNVG
jgi:hypothetical protein